MLPEAQLYTRLLRQLRGRAIFFTEPGGRITTWNPGVEQLLGYLEAEWVGRDISILSSAAQPAPSVETATLCWYRTSAGREILVDCLLVPVTDDEGAVAAFSYLLSEATEAQHIEDALRRSEEQLRFAQEGADLGIWDWDIASHRITRSPVHCRLYGQLYNPDPEPYDRWIALVHPDDRARLDAQNHLALLDGAVDTEFRIIRLDGELRWLHARGRVYYEDGLPRRMVRIVRDITPQKLAEQALAGSEARKTAILNASLDAILVMSGQGLLQEFNPAAEQMFGYSRSEAVGRTLAELVVPPALRDAHARGLARYLATGEPHVVGRRIEITAMRSGGAEFPVELAIVRVPVEGEPVFAGFVRDITERKRTEDALRRSNEELADFANIVAHDLQTPLRTIHTYTELLSARYACDLNPKAASLLSHVLTAAGTMSALIEGLLGYATAGEDAPQEPVDLGALVEAVSRALAVPLEEVGGRIFCDPLPVIAANPVQMQQLFQNLIGNALKYRRPGVPPEVRISARSSRNQWIVSIADNGEGIAPEYRKKIFAPLSRLHGGDVPGTGLGLAVCKKIVERLGGRIWVENSTPAPGATFRFTLEKADVLP